MRKNGGIAISLFLLVAIVCLPFVTDAAQDVPQEVLDACSSVVRIEVESTSMRGSGSGFVIRSDRSGTLIVTNAHVIIDSKQNISVWVTNEEKQTADIVYISEQYDLAIIRLERIVDAKALKLSSDVSQGMSVYAVGYPAAADNLSEHEARTNQEATITDGLISATRTMRIVSYGPEISILQISATINPGNSGGPLFNSKGEVVGVNALGVTDSQGIFGAIATSELLGIIKTEGIDLEKNEQTLPLWIVGVAAAIIAIIILIMSIVGHKKKIKKKHRFTLPQSAIPLTNFIRSWPRDIEDADIVSIMMPVANKLRDMHLNGKLYLKLSPQVLNATLDGVVLSETNPPDFTIAEFTSPEQLSKTAVGVKSDIYSFFCVMEYLRSINRQNVEDENTSEIPISPEVPNSSLLDKVIARGMAAEADARFSSMQEAIYELAPLNSGVPQSYVKLFDQSTHKKDENSIRHRDTTLAAILISALLTICLFLGFETFCYFRAEKHIEAMEFAQADKMMRRVLLVHKLFPDEWAYLQAGVKMVNGDYDTAIERFTLLGEYKQSVEYVNEANYRKAAYLADQGQFASAAMIYSNLGTYRDSANKRQATMNRYAYYLLESEDYFGAITQFNLLNQQGYASAGDSLKEVYFYWACSLIDKEDYISAYETMLKAGDYSEVSAMLPSLKEAAYYSAVDLYHQGKYLNARDGFDLFGSYLESDAYLVLIEAHTRLISSSFVWSKLVPLTGFEDAADLLVSTDSIATYFLIGEWRGDSKRFDMYKDGSITYSVPWINYGEYYRIEDGEVLLYNEGSYQTTRTMWRITVIDANCIQIYAYKNGGTYTLFRR